MGCISSKPQTPLKPQTGRAAKKDELPSYHGSSSTSEAIETWVAKLNNASEYQYMLHPILLSKMAENQSAAVQHSTQMFTLALVRKECSVDVYFPSYSNPDEATARQTEERKRLEGLASLNSWEDVKRAWQEIKVEVGSEDDTMVEEINKKIKELDGKRGAGEHQKLRTVCWLAESMLWRTQKGWSGRQYLEKHQQLLNMIKQNTNAPLTDLVVRTFNNLSAEAEMTFSITDCPTGTIHIVIAPSTITGIGERKLKSEVSRIGGYIGDYEAGKELRGRR